MAFVSGDAHPLSHTSSLSPYLLGDPFACFPSVSPRHVVLLLCLLAAILAIVFSTRTHRDAKGISCRNRCAAADGDTAASCHCGPTCEAEGTCCLDYEEVCLAPRFTDMDMAKGEDVPAEQAASLFGTPAVVEDEALRLVLLLCLLAAILAIVFSTKTPCDAKGISCRNRCAAADGDTAASCHCGPTCEAEGTCCLDYEEVCLAPSAADMMTWLDGGCENIGLPQCPPGFSKPPVVLVSMDGFRASYLKVHGGVLPVLRKLRRCGTTTSHMRPVYPSKTFPNHYSIVTSHGIVDNKMYDVTRNASFSLRVPEKGNPKWYQGEPVWLTAMRNKLKVGTFFWPGSDVAIDGRLPDYYMNYTGGIPFEKRVSTLLEWLDLPAGKRPDFYTLYLEEPDKAGHRFGPDSNEVREALQNVDTVLGFLIKGLMQRGLHRCVNLVLVSDHGMEEASCSRAAYISDYQNNTDDFTIIQGPAARVRPVRLPEDFFSFDYEGLVKNLSCRKEDQPMRPYLKEDLPKRLHFANNVRIERAHLYMRAGWQAGLRPKEIKYCSGGFHGSDNLFGNMQHQTTVTPFENIEVYNLLCDLLGISPAPNNGTHGSLNHLLKRPVHHPVHPAQRSYSLLCLAISPRPQDDLGCTCGSITPAEEEALNVELIKDSF
ncbi:hypothetical protein NHX12_025733, partial [Muraenolepis orangiensis]